MVTTSGRQPYCMKCRETGCVHLKPGKGGLCYYAPASDLNSVLKEVQAGKLYGVIPTAIDKTAVIKVMPSKESSTQIQPSLMDLKISESLNKTLDQLNTSQKTTKGTADKTQQAIRDFLRP